MDQKEATRPNAQRIYSTERKKILEMWECICLELRRTDATLKNHLLANFPHQRPLSEEGLMHEIRSGKLFGYVQCDLKVPEHLKAYFEKYCCK